MQTPPNSEAWLNVANVGMSDDSQSIVAGILGHAHKRLTISGAGATYLSPRTIMKVWRLFRKSR